MHLKTTLTVVLASALSFIGSVRADITTGLVLSLPLDETSGTTANDSSGLGNHATLVNFPGDNSQWTEGWFNGGIKLNSPLVPGSTNYLTIPDAPSINFGTSLHFTVATWVKMPAAQIAGAALIAKGTGGGGEQFDLDIAASRFRMVTRFTSGAAVTLSSATTISSNWTHVVVAWDGAEKTLRMYINGQLSSATTNNNLAAVIASTAPVTIGARQSNATPGNYNLAVQNTTMDDVRIYNRTLSASDAFELYSVNGRKPTVATQPRNVSTYVGETAIFRVGVDAFLSTMPVTYQWKQGATIVDGGTNATLILTNVQLASAGNYSVEISNALGSTNSDAAALQVQALPAADITGGLVGHWKFDEASGSSTAVDSSANANPGALLGFSDVSTVWVPGLISGALKFNGDASTANFVAIPGEAVEAPAVLDFAANPTFTLATWVNGSAVQTNSAGIITKGAGAGGEQYAVDLQGGVYRFYMRNAAGAATEVRTTAGPNGTWQHLAAVFNASNGVMNIYLNGQLSGINVAPFSVNTNAHEVAFGNRQSGAATAYNLPFSGAMDDVRIYNRNLTIADVQALYLTGGVFPPEFTQEPQGASLYAGDDITLSTVASGTAPITFQWRKNGTNMVGATNANLVLANVQVADAGTYTLFATNSYGNDLSAEAVLQVSPFLLTDALAGYWKFDETTGTTTTDSSANANHGFLNNFPGDDSHWIDGRVDGGLNFNFDGLGQMVVAVPDAPSLNFNSSPVFTMAAWVRGPAAQIGGAAIFAKGTGAGGEQYILDMFGGVYRLVLRNSAGAATVLNAPAGPTGFWEHVAAVVDGISGTSRIYINGQLLASGAAPNTLLETAQEVSIGSRWGNASSGYNLPFVGMIDDARIYSRALSSSQIQELYAFAGPFAPVVYTDPADVTVFAGERITLFASADGTAPLNFQWQKGGVNIPNATNTTLILDNAQLSDGGSYRMQVVGGGEVFSAAALVTVLPLPAPDLTTALTAHWTFDETTGTSAADSSGNGYIATLFDFPVDNSQWVAGKIGGALRFGILGDGANRAGPETPISLANGDEFTFSFWAKRDPGAFGPNPRIISPLGNHWVLWNPNRGVGLHTSAPSPEPTTNDWRHFVLVYNRPAGIYSLYVDGFRVVNEVTGYVRPDPNNLNWIIGHSENGGTHSESWVGLLDDMRIYNRLLNANDVQALYTIGAPPAISVTQNGNSVTIAWPRAASGFQLQSAPDLSGGGWGNVGGSPVVSADGYTQSVTETLGTGSKFYRLQKP